MANPLCLSPLKFYDSRQKQAHRKSYAYGHVSPVICYGNTIIPFQFAVDANGSISNISLYRRNDVFVNDITDGFPGLRFINISDKYYVVQCVGGQIVQITQEGEYYISITVNDVVYYSDIFCCTNYIDDCLLIEYWCSDGDLYVSNSIITFANSFHFKMYLRTELGKPEYEFEEEATKRLGYSFVESQISRKKYKFNAVLPEPMCDALRIVRLCSSKTITSRGDSYDAINFEMNSDWQTQGDLASVSCEFEVDNVVVNLGGDQFKRYTTPSGHADTSGYADRAGYAETAGTADHANSAFTLDSNSPILSQFLSRLIDDVAQGHITFEQGLTTLASSIFKDTITAEARAFFQQGLEVGNFVASLYTGSGAGVDQYGNAEVESLKVRSYMEVMELIINRLSAIEGDQLLTEADTIERVEDLGDGTYRLHLKSKWEGYFTAQKEGNVLKGIINTLSQGSGTYNTAWMRVLSVNTANNTIEVLPYPDDEVPAQQNFLPQEMMKIARWGNAIDTTRQSCLFLSSTDGRIVKLSHVTRPIIDEGNYGFAIGQMPDWIIESGLPLQEGADYAYFKGIIVQDIIRMDYQGRPIPTFVDRGPWVANPEEPYHYESINSQTGVYETSDVWYLGCKWRCISDNPQGAPAWNSTEWAMVEGNPFFTIDIESSRGDFFDYDNFHTVLSITGKLYNNDVTSSIADADVEWTRYSEDAQGNPRTASDNAWAIRRANEGKQIELTQEDVDFDGVALPILLRFIARVTFRDGMTDEAIFEYNNT